MIRELALICQGCRREIVSAGYLWAHTGDVAAHQRARRLWRERYDRPGGYGVDMVGLFAHPVPVCWQAHHQQCDRAREESHYRIAAGRLHSRADLLEWTAHLMRKTWLPGTDWHDVLREARAGGERITVITP
ncbi:hypothetical protein [Streptomyces antibioticus]|uniref:hypothetical protein n=1 Tax=Streptomyces antibioticus TaxID=1890 RepID=UPI0033CF376C